MLVHPIEYGDGSATTFFLRKHELAALFTLQLKKEPLHFHFDVERRAVYTVNNYAALRLQQMQTEPLDESLSVAMKAEALADSVKRMAAADYLAIIPPTGDGKSFEVAVIRRPTKMWVPHDGTSWQTSVLDADCLVLEHAVPTMRTGRASDKIEGVFPTYVQDKRERGAGSPPPRTDFYAFNSGMLDTMVKIGKATKDATVYCYTPPSELDPVLMRMDDENDLSTWTLLLMPIRTGSPVTVPVLE